MAEIISLDSVKKRDKDEDTRVLFIKSKLTVMELRKAILSQVLEETCKEIDWLKKLLKE